MPSPLPGAQHRPAHPLHAPPPRPNQLACKVTSEFRANDAIFAKSTTKQEKMLHDLLHAAVVLPALSLIASNAAYMYGFDVLGLQLMIWAPGSFFL